MGGGGERIMRGKYKEKNFGSFVYHSSKADTELVEGKCFVQSTFQLSRHNRGITSRGILFLPAKETRRNYT